MLLLRVTLNETTRTYAVEELPCAIGSSPGCVVHIADESVKGEAARIESGKDGPVLLGDVVLDGVPVAEVPLDRNRILTLGNARIEVLTGPLADGRAASADKGASSSRLLSALRLLGLVVLVALIAGGLEYFLGSMALTGKAFVTGVLASVVVTGMIAGILAIPVKLISGSFFYGALVRWFLVVLFVGQVFLRLTPPLEGLSDHPLWYGLFALLPLVFGYGAMYTLSRIAFVKRPRRVIHIGVGTVFALSAGLLLLFQYLNRDEDPFFDRSAVIGIPLRSYSATSHPIKDLLEKIQKSRTQVDAYQKERGALPPSQPAR